MLATTRDVADELRRFLEGRALRVPPVAVVPLPAQFGDTPRVVEARLARDAGAPLKLVSVVTWERRKNLLGLLSALAQARRAAPVPLQLTLVGRRGYDAAFDVEVDALLAATSDVTVAGTLPDAALAALVDTCDATLYPSFEEGFGLPVVESLWLGRPCLCHDGSSLAEIAPGGGTMMVDMRNEAAVADALVSLVTRPDHPTRLAAEATRWSLTSWDDYAGAVAATMDDPAWR